MEGEETGIARRRLAQALGVVFALALGAFFALVAAEGLRSRARHPHALWLHLSAAGLAVAPVLLLFAWFRGEGLRRWHQAQVAELSAAVDGLADRRPLLWIALFSGLALFLELAVIRWTGAYLPGLSHYRNFGLLACFLGLGLGYTVGRRSLDLAPYLLPLAGLHYLQVTWVGAFARPGDTAWALFRSPAWQFALIVVATLPAGLLAGRLLARESNLRGYGANLVGSTLGVVALNLVAALWSPPLLWLGLMGALYLVAFQRLRGTLLALGGLALCLLLAWGTARPSQLEVFSPYQRLVLRPNGFGHQLGHGRAGVFANSKYYQSFAQVDTQRLKPDADVQAQIPNADLSLVRRDLKGARVLALGAGAGANLPALLRAGVSRVVAVDIDPVIVQLGRELNADRPYHDPRVTVVVDDARAYLRRTREQFDVVCFFWIDSYPAGSTGLSAFRVDSFVYTQECFEDVKRCLAPNGRLLVYAWMVWTLSRQRIHQVLTQVFDGRVGTYQVKPFDQAQTLFTVGAVHEADRSAWIVPAPLKPAPELRPVTDDWPFLYLPPGAGLSRFLPFLGLVLLVSLLGYLLSARAGALPRTRLAVFFLFGAAFMLVETVSIMQVALLFGYTWQVIGVVICAILTMAFVGNLLVERGLLPRSRPLWFTGLLLSLLVVWQVRANDVADWTTSLAAARALYVTLAALPILFSAVLFSLLVDDSGGELDQALGINLLGAMLGGSLEYAAMEVGYQGLTLAIPLLYLLAAACWWRSSGEAPASAG